MSAYHLYISEDQKDPACITTPITFIFAAKGSTWICEGKRDHKADPLWQKW